MSTYRLPHDVRDRLAAALRPLRNRDACLALATFVARFWTAPRKLGLPFMLDRRALAPVEALGLSEARVQRRDPGAGAHRVPRPSRDRRADASGDAGGPAPQARGVHVRGRPTGRLRAANKRAAGGPWQAFTGGATQTPAAPQRASTALPAARPTNSPKYKPSEATKVYLGEKHAATPPPIETNLKLEAALDRWRRAAEGQDLFGSG